MKHLHSLLLLSVMTASGLAAAGPDSTYRAPRAHDGHPDLQGVWNFASGVPLQRRAALSRLRVELHRPSKAAIVSTMMSTAPIHGP